MPCPIKVLRLSWRKTDLSLRGFGPEPSFSTDALAQSGTWTRFYFDGRNGHGPRDNRAGRCITPKTV
jgi:hypothetical protein